MILIWLAPSAKFPAHRAADLIWAVYNLRHAEAVVVRLLRELVLRVKKDVTVASRLRDVRCGRIDAGSI